jgi:accessory gene regulator B
MDIFKKIEDISYRIAHRIGKNDSKDDIELYEYSIFMIMSNSFTILCGLILSIIFGYLTIYIICLLSYISLRTVAGGQHCDTFQKCFFVSNAIIIVCCILSFFTRSIPNIMWIFSVFSSINTLPICPKPSINSPSRGYSEDIRFRRKLSFRLSILLLLSLVFIYFNLYLLSTSISAGILILCFVLTDFGEKIISMVSK